MTDRAGANSRAGTRFAARLPAAVADWEAAGIINEDQAGAILARYEQGAEGATSQGRLVTILVTLGAVLVGLGVILFFAANWQEFSKEAKLALMLVVVPVAYGVGYWVRYRRNYAKVGTALILLAALLYGAAIHLVAQAYHVPVNHPNLVGLWFLGVIPLAYVTRSQSVLTLGIVLGFAAVGFRGQEWLADEEWIPFRAFPLYLLLGLAVYGLKFAHEKFQSTKTLAIPLEVAGLVAVFAAIYALTFRIWWQEIANRWGVQGPPQPDVTAEFWVLGAGAVVVMVAGFATAWFSAMRRGNAPGLLLGQGLAAAVCVALACLVVFPPQVDDWVFPLAFNLLLLCGIVGLLYWGYYSGREWLINLGLLFFGIDIFTRYFEFSFDLLDRSVVFIVAGVILLAGGFMLERGRRLMLGRLRTLDGDV